MNKTDSRIAYIDIAKGLVIFFTIWCHLGGVGTSAYSIFPEGIFLIINPAAFMLSGYFFSTKRGFRTFCVKKSQQLLLPYLIYLLPIYIYNYLWGVYYNVDYAEVASRSSIHNAPTWFIYSLWMMSCIYYLLNMVFKKKLQLGIAVLTCVGIGYLLKRYTSVDFKIGQSLMYMIYYYIGHMYKSHYSNLDLLNRWQIQSICFPIFICIAFLYSISDQWVDIISSSILYFLAAFSGSFIVVSLSYKIKQCRFLEYLGRNSLIILCTHQYCLFIACRPTGITNPWLQLFIAMILVLISVEFINRFMPWTIGKFDMDNTKNYIINYLNKFQLRLNPFK